MLRNVIGTIGMLMEDNKPVGIRIIGVTTTGKIKLVDMPLEGVLEKFHRHPKIGWYMNSLVQLPLDTRKKGENIRVTQYEARENFIIHDIRDLDNTNTSHNKALGYILSVLDGTRTLDMPLIIRQILVPTGEGREQIICTGLYSDSDNRKYFEFLVRRRDEIFSAIVPYEHILYNTKRVLDIANYKLSGVLTAVTPYAEKQTISPMLHQLGITYVDTRENISTLIENYVDVIVNSYTEIKLYPHSGVSVNEVRDERIELLRGYLTRGNVRNTGEDTKLDRIVSLATGEIYKRIKKPTVQTNQPMSESAINEIVKHYFKPNDILMEFFSDGKFRDSKKVVLEILRSRGINIRR